MTKNLLHYKRIYHNRNTAIQMLESVYWGDVPRCPYCKSTYQTPYKDGFRYKCNSCSSSYSVLVDTLFEKTRVPFYKWFYVINITLNGVQKPVRVLAEEIGTTKDTAWLMLKRIDNVIRVQRSILEQIIS